MKDSGRPAVGFLALIAALSVVGGCASSAPQSDIDLRLDDEEIQLTMSEAWARAAVGGLLGSALDCRGDVDAGLRELLEELDRGGTRSRAVRRDGETTLEARRRGGRLALEIAGDGPGSIELTMPWAVAGCLLGRPTSVDRTITSAIRVEVKNPDGRDISFTIN